MNVVKFKEWLVKLRAVAGEDKICLFMDQLSAHTSKQTKEEMKRLGFRYIYNVAYSPDFNPIELVFAKVKQRFRRLRAQKLVGELQVDHVGLVTRSVKAVRKQDIIHCIASVAKLLESSKATEQ